MTKNATMLTTAEVATMAKVRTQTIRCYRCRGTFPEPDAYVGNTPVWKLSTVRAWLKVRPPVGRPKGS